MKRILTLILTVAMLLSTAALIPASAEQTVATDGFVDVADDFWGKDAIDWAVQAEITNGVDATHFAPDASLTRAQFVMFLSRVAQLLRYDTGNNLEEYPFTDVKLGSWFRDPAFWAYENGIVTGTGKSPDGKEYFSPDSPISRQEMAVMVDRFLTKYIGVSCGLSGGTSYPDQAKIASWAKSASASMQYTGLIRGDTNGNFMPLGQTSRAAAVTVIQRLYELVVGDVLTDRDGNDYDGTSYSRIFRLSKYETYENLDGFLTQDADATEEIGTYTCGRFSVTATLGQSGSIALTSPDAAEAYRAFDLSAYAEKDGREHTYDLIWLDNNMYVFFVDGIEVHRVGDEYVAPVADTQPATLSLTGEMRVDSVSVYRYVDLTPFGKHGALHTRGNKLLDSNNQQYMINGLHIFNGGSELKYCSYESMKWLRDDWGIDCIRVASVLDEMGYGVHGIVAGSDDEIAQMKQNIIDAVDTAESLGMYLIIDWHGLDESRRYDNPDVTMERADPNLYLPEAKEFFAQMSERFAACDHVIYELYNEPLSGKGTYPDDYDAAYAYAWQRIKEFSEQLIPIIRENDPNALILVPSPSACQQPQLCAKDPIDSENIVYTMHFYAGVHGEWLVQNTQNALNAGLPVYISEFGRWDDGVLTESDTDYNSMPLWLRSVEKMSLSNCLFSLGRGDDDRHALLNPSVGDLLSGWTDDQLNPTGRYMRHWYRRQAGLE